MLVTADGSLQPVPAPTSRDLFSLAWSPDGQLLAVVAYDDNYKPSLFLTGPGASEAVALDSGYLEAGFGATFAPDGQILYAAEGQWPTDATSMPTVELRQIAAEAGAPPATLGQFTHVVGCGGGSPIPADWQLWRESGFGGSYLSLQWTPLGILHSTACSGGSASLFDPATDTDRPLGPTFDQNDMTSAGPITRLVVSPDGTEAAGIRATYTDNQALTSLVRIDLATGTVTDVPTLQQPDQLAWGLDGSIYYSTRTPSRMVDAGMSDAERSTLATALGYSSATEMPGLSAYTVTIEKLDPATGTETTVLSEDAYAIGRMRVAADGTLVYSTIANLDAWAQAIISGTLDLVNDTNGAESRALVPISVYRLNAGETAPSLIGANLEQFELRPVAVG